jgi:hypothetical protein
MDEPAPTWPPLSPPPPPSKFQVVNSPGDLPEATKRDGISEPYCRLEMVTPKVGGGALPRAAAAPRTDARLLLVLARAFGSPARMRDRETSVSRLLRVSGGDERWRWRGHEATPKKHSQEAPKTPGKTPKATPRTQPPP